MPRADDNSDPLLVSAPTHVRPNERVIVAKDGVGFVCVDVLGEEYYTLNHTAAYIWQLLCDGALVSAIVDDVAQHYGIPRGQAADDVGELIRRLLAHNLVQPA
jgi:hypothetical protein